MHEIIASRLPPRVGNANFHQTSISLSLAYPLFTFSNEENSINMAEERKRNVVHATSDIADQSSLLFVFFFFFFLSWMESVPYWLKQHERASSFEHV